MMGLDFFRNAWLGEALSLRREYFQKSKSKTRLLAEFCRIALPRQPRCIFCFALFLRCGIDSLILNYIRNVTGGRRFGNEESP